MSDHYYFSLNIYNGQEEAGHHIQMPVLIGVDTLPNELEVCLATVARGNFISWRDVGILEIIIYLLTEKLEAYYKIYPEEARIAGERMISMLEGVDTDDDIFPQIQIESITKIIGK